MRKIINTFLITTFIILLGACSDNDSDNYSVSQEWIDYQADVLNRIKTMKDNTGNLVYMTKASTSKDGSIFYKESDYITKNNEGQFDKDGPDPLNPIMQKGLRIEDPTKPIYDTDRVRVRYEGWYYNMDDKKIVFDSTEKNISTGESMNNNKYAEFTVGLVVDGFTTMIKEMEVGEEYIVVMPHQMAYGISGNYGSAVTIPGYTTLFFDVKLFEIKERE